MIHVHSVYIQNIKSRAQLSRVEDQAEQDEEHMSSDSGDELESAEGEEGALHERHVYL